MIDPFQSTVDRDPISLLSWEQGNEADPNKNEKRVHLMRLLSLAGSTGLCCLMLHGTAVAELLNEQEPNHPIDAAQRLAINGTEVSISGVLGEIGASPAVADLDFYSFEATAGDTFTFDIDGGMGGQQSLNTYLGVFGPGPDYYILRWNDNASVDPGSSSFLDARIKDFTAPATGTYTVGVSNTRRNFRDGGLVYNPSYVLNGDYTLVITVKRGEMHVPIDIRPGNEKAARVNPKRRGNMQVAILSTTRFDASNVDAASLTFGARGEEPSLKRCEPKMRDVNRDGRKDLVCHFDMSHAAFDRDATEGQLKGRLADDTRIRGRDMLLPVPNAD